MEELKIIRPRRELRPYVRYYWVLKRDTMSGTLTFPIGCPQIIFHRRTPLYIPELGRVQDRFTISGQVNFPAHVSSNGAVDMIVAVFYPHTIGMFIGIPPSAFYNQEISGYDIGNISLNNLADAIFGCSDSVEAIGLLEGWLMNRVIKTVNNDRIEAVVRVILKSPAMGVSSLAGIACVCEKQLERIFRYYVGMNPKEYCCIARFQKALRMMQLGALDYAGIAYSAGYSDQSHFIRDFRRYSGFSPRQLLQCTEPYSDLYTDPV